MEQQHHSEIEAGRSLVRVGNTYLVTGHRYNLDGVDLQVEDLEDMQDEVDELEEEVEGLRETREKLMAKLNEFMTSLKEDPTVKDLVAKIEDLQNTLADLERMRSALMDDLSQTDAGAGREERQQEAPRNPEEEEVERLTEGTGDRNRRRACKSLYLKIAARCHPDKTKDPDLNEIFVLAVKFYKAVNLEALGDLWEAIKGGGMRRSRIRKKLEALREEIETLRQELQAATSSDAATLMRVAVAEGRLSALHHFRQALKHNIGQMTLHKEHTLQMIDLLRQRREERMAEAQRVADIIDDDPEFDKKFTGEDDGA